MFTQERFRYMPMDGEVFFKHFHDHSSQIVWTVRDHEQFDLYEVTAHLGRATATATIAKSSPEELDGVWDTLLMAQRRLLRKAELVIYADGSATWR